MVTIKDLVESIKDECKGAKRYANLALEYKGENKILADLYAKTAEVELGHINQFHDVAVKMIKDYQSKGEPTPAAMKLFWDWAHEEMTKDVVEIKTLLDWYKAP